MNTHQEIISILSELGLQTKKVAETRGGEYHGPCPFCGGSDRFTVRPNDPASKQGFFICRNCNQKGNLNKLIKMLKPDSEIPQWDNPDHKPSTSIHLPSQTPIPRDPPSPAWQMAMKNLLNAQPISTLQKSILAMRHIKEETAVSCGLKYISQKKFVTVNGHDRKICVPDGLLIPNYRDDTLFSVHVRQLNKESKYIYVKGSAGVPYHRSKLNHLGAPVFVVESELDALLIFQEAGDLVHAIALCSVTSRPDSHIIPLLTTATHLFVCLDYDKPGHDEWPWWHSNYPQALQVFSPTGKDIGDYKLGGGSIRNWIQDLIVQAEQKIEIVSRPIPNFKAHSLPPEKVEKVIAQLKDTDSHLSIIVKTPLILGDCKDLGLVSPKLIALATDQHAFAIDLTQVPATSLRGLEDCKLVTYGGLNQMTQFQMMGLNITAIDCVGLQHDALYPKKCNLEDILQFRMGYGSVKSNPNFNAEVYSHNEVLAALTEAYAIGRLFEVQKNRLETLNKTALYQIMAGSIPAMAQIQLNGLFVDWDGHEQLTEEWQNALDSNSTSELTREQLKARLNTWGKPLKRFRSPRTDRLHPSFSFNGTVTGRFSCNNPSIQNVPKDMQVRKLFHAQSGHILVGADYGQLELRVIAMLSEDQTMIEAFSSGADLHKLVATKIFHIAADEVTPTQRDTAKKSVYNVMYGGWDPNLAAELKTTFPDLFEWRARQKSQQAFLATHSGRRILRDFSDGNDWSKQVINYPVQSTSADVMFAALSRLPGHLSGLDAKIVNCVHDEILLEVSDNDATYAKEALERAMIEGFQEIFPNAPTLGLVVAKIGRSWADVK